MRTYLVTLAREPRTGRNAHGWDTTVKAVEKTDATYQEAFTDPLVIGVWATEAHRSATAIAVVMEWLARGRPNFMTVAAVREVQAR